MNKNYKIDFTTMTLTMSKSFAEAAYNPSSDEYKTLKRLQKDFPNLTVAKRTHRSPSKANPNKGMTYERMERFIDALPKAKEYREQYDFLKAFAPNPYQSTRKWFMEQFPKYRTNLLYYTECDVAIVSASDIVVMEETVEEKAS